VTHGREHLGDQCVIAHVGCDAQRVTEMNFPSLVVTYIVGYPAGKLMQFYARKLKVAPRPSCKPPVQQCRSDFRCEAGVDGAPDTLSAKSVVYLSK
jgi:hypothetical protein